MCTPLLFILNPLSICRKLYWFTQTFICHAHCSVLRAVQALQMYSAIFSCFQPLILCTCVATASYSTWEVKPCYGQSRKLCCYIFSLGLWGIFGKLLFKEEFTTFTTSVSLVRGNFFECFCPCYAENLSFERLIQQIVREKFNIILMLVRRAENYICAFKSM